MTDLAELRLQAARLKAAKLKELAMSRNAAPQAQPSTAPAGEITLPDGTRMVFDPKTGSYTSAELMAGNMSPGVGASALAGAAQGATFGWGDELASLAGASPLAVERSRAAVMAANREHPYVTGAANLAGSAAMAIPALSATPAAITGGASLAGQTVAGTVLGAGVGAVQGAGEANGRNVVEQAATGGIIGGTIGAIAPWAAAGLKSGSQRVIAYLRKTDISGIKNALGIGTDAAKIVRAHLQNGDTQAAIAAMDRAGPEAMIADSSPQASQLLDATVAAGGPSQQIAANAVEGRSTQAAAGLKGAMDSVLGPAQGLRATANDIASRTAATRKAAYDAAYGSPINYASPEGIAIEGVLARVPDSTLTAAIKEANDAMKAAGIKNMQLMASIDPAGNVSFREMPNVQQLDFLKRALGSVADGAKDIFGRYTAEGVRANKLAIDLRDAVGAAVPSYRTAVRLGGDKIAEDKALELGRKFMLPSVTREDVALQMKGSSAESRMAAKRGMRTAFDEAMANVKSVASDQNVDARQAMAAVKQFSSEANRAKAEEILGKSAATKLFTEFDKAATQLALRTAIARNSATAARTAGREAMQAIVDSPMEAFKRGEVAKGARGLMAMMTRATPADRTQKEQAIFAEVALALTQQRGAQAKQALEIVQRAIAGTPATQADAALVSRAITTALAGGAYRSAQQYRSTSTNGLPRPQ